MQAYFPLTSILKTIINLQQCLRECGCLSWSTKETEPSLLITLESILNTTAATIREFRSLDSPALRMLTIMPHNKYLGRIMSKDSALPRVEDTTSQSGFSYSSKTGLRENDSYLWVIRNLSDIQCIYTMRRAITSSWT